MDALLPLFGLGECPDKAANTLAAARALVPHLNRSRALDRKLAAGVMTTSFGGADADGAWSCRDAYDAMEAALVLADRGLDEADPRPGLGREAGRLHRRRQAAGVQRRRRQHDIHRGARQPPRPQRGVRQGGAGVAGVPDHRRSLACRAAFG
jgi:hypothetical protein